MPDIIMVEDNELDIDLVREAFCELGFACAVHLAMDGEAALRLFARIGGDLPSPALIILDLNIPRVGGLELLTHVRARTVLQRVPVVVFSGSLNPRDRDAALAQGATVFLQKPSDVDGYLAVGRRMAALASGDG